MLFGGWLGKCDIGGLPDHLWSVEREPGVNQEPQEGKRDNDGSLMSRNELEKGLED